HLHVERVGTDDLRGLHDRRLIGHLPEIGPLVRPRVLELEEGGRALTGHRIARSAGPLPVAGRDDRRRRSRLTRANLCEGAALLPPISSPAEEIRYDRPGRRARGWPGPDRHLGGCDRPRQPDHRPACYNRRGQEREPPLGHATSLHPCVSRWRFAPFAQISCVADTVSARPAQPEATAAKTPPENPGS